MVFPAPKTRPAVCCTVPLPAAEIVREVDTSRRQLAGMGEAMRAAGIPLPPALEKELNMPAATPEQLQEARKRNAILVTPGLAPEGTAGFAPPQRKGPADGKRGGAGVDARLLH